MTLRRQPALEANPGADVYQWETVSPDRNPSLDGVSSPTLTPEQEGGQRTG
jgi:hypothetical protein